MIEDVKEQSILYISINPDLENTKFGHFYSYDKSINDAVMSKKNCNFISVSNRLFNLNEYHDDMVVLPYFSINTWDILTRKGELSLGYKKFTIELANLLCELEEKIKTHSVVHFIFYLGSLGVITSLFDALSRLNLKNFKNCNFHINLFWSFKDIQESGSILHHSLYEDISQLVSEEKRIRIYSESKRLTKILKSHMNCEIDIWHPFLVSSSMSCNDIGQKSLHNQDEDLIVLFPGSNTSGKGYLYTLDALHYFAKNAKKYSDVKFIIRHLDKGDDDYKQYIATLYLCIGSVRIEVIDNSITHEDYADLYRASSIVVIPYEAHTFMYRTSGCYFDALFSKSPIICNKNTWIGRRVHSNKLGYVAEQETGESLYNAISLLINDVRNSVYSYPKIETLKEKSTSTYFINQISRNAYNGDVMMMSQINHLKLQNLILRYSKKKKKSLKKFMKTFFVNYKK